MCAEYGVFSLFEYDYSTAIVVKSGHLQILSSSVMKHRISVRKASVGAENITEMI